jgi:predicted nucleic acid-binding protein
MTLYLDTSSLIKLFVEEPGGDEVRQHLSEADAVATSLITYAEARATFARLRRTGGFTSDGFRSAKRDFDEDWSNYLVVEPSLELCRAAGDLAERYHLRGCDSIQLATFLQLAGERRASDTRFSSFDSALNRAAAAALRHQRKARV